MDSRQKMLETVIVGIVFLLMCTTTSHAGHSSVRAVAENRGVIGLNHAVTVNNRTFDIEVVKFDLTGNCQLRVELQNKGSVLSKEQHRNSTLQIGQDTPISLSVIDPGLRLCTKNGIAIYIKAKPILKETNMNVNLTLFNGTRKNWTKTLKPTCARARLESVRTRNIDLKKGNSGHLPGSSRMINPQPEPPGKHVKPSTGSSKMINPQPEPPGKHGMINPQPEPPGKEIKH